MTPGTTEVPLRRFGRTDLEVSALGLGCARIGGIFKQDPNEFLNLLSVAFDAGINFFDTADIYSQGESERLLGRAFRHRRDQVVIASKAGFLLPAQRRMLARLKPFVRPLIGLIGLARHHVPAAVRGALAQDFSPAHLQRSVEGSLKRLATDHLDLFQLHGPPPAVVETTEWVAMLERLKQQGKIRYYGVSCDTLEAAHAALEHPGVSSLQLSISLLERRVLSTLPLAHARGVAVIAREVLANGLLVKKASEIDLRSYCESDEEAAAKAVLLNECRQTATERGAIERSPRRRSVRSLPAATRARPIRPLTCEAELVASHGRERFARQAEN